MLCLGRFCSCSLGMKHRKRTSGFCRVVTFRNGGEMGLKEHGKELGWAFLQGVQPPCQMSQRIYRHLSLSLGGLCRLLTCLLFAAALPFATDCRLLACYWAPFGLAVQQFRCRPQGCSDPRQWLPSLQELLLLLVPEPRRDFARWVARQGRRLLLLLLTADQSPLGIIIATNTAGCCGCAGSGGGR